MVQRRATENDHQVMGVALEVGVVDEFWVIGGNLASFDSKETQIS